MGGTSEVGGVGRGEVSMGVMEVSIEEGSLELRLEPGLPPP